jgi:hypothetical protein
MNSCGSCTAVASKSSLRFRDAIEEKRDMRAVRT